MNKNNRITDLEMSEVPNKTSESARVTSEKIRAKWYIRVKYMLYIVCTLCLLKQAYSLIMQFMSATHVSSSFDHYDDVIPGITVCLPMAISMERFVDYQEPKSRMIVPNPNSLENMTFDSEDEDFLSENSWYFAKVIKALPKSLVDLKEDSPAQFNAYFTKKYKEDKVFKKYYDRLTTYYKTFDINPNDFYENLYMVMQRYLVMDRASDGLSPSYLFDMTIPYSEVKCGKYGNVSTWLGSEKGVLAVSNNGSFECPPVTVWVRGLKGDPNSKEKLIKDEWITDSEPIESVVLPKFYFTKKCFTFFSHVKEKWRRERKYIKNINLKINYNNLWFPKKYLDKEGYEIALHNPDEMPRVMMQLKPYEEIEMTYTMAITDKTEAKSMVDCTDYDLESKWPEKRMKTECIKHCMQDMRDECSNCSAGGQKCLFRDAYHWTEEQMPSPMFKIPNIGHDKCTKYELRFETLCAKRCHFKCVNRVYSYQKKSSIQSFESLIRLTHRHILDLITQVMPKMSWVDFFSGLGGLFGLWLGLSFYAMYDHVVSLFGLVKKLVCKSRKSKITHV